MLSTRSTRCTALLGLTALVLATARPAHAQRYTITDLGILPGKTSTAVFGNHSINQAGHIVGHCNIGDTSNGLAGDYFSGNVAFLWTKERGIQALPLLPGAAYASGYTLNDCGQVIGIAGNSYLDARLVLWENGTVRAFDPLPGDTTTYPQAINNHGDIVGFSGKYEGNPIFSGTPVLWHKGKNKPIVLPTDGYPGGQANDINEKGQICGLVLTVDRADSFHAVPVLWDKGAVTILGSLGGDFGYAWDINEKTQIVGQSQASDRSIHAFFWEKGAMTDLGTLGGTWGAMWALNNKGEAVGDSTTANDAADHAILVKKGVMTDINDLLPPGSGWVLVIADGINDRSQISGMGVYNGQVRGFLLTPIHHDHDDDDDDGDH